MAAATPNGTVSEDILKHARMLRAATRDPRYAIEAAAWELFVAKVVDLEQRGTKVNIAALIDKL